MEFERDQNEEMTRCVHLLSQKGGPTDDAGRPTNGYAIRLAQGSILVDAATEAYHDGILEIAKQDPPGALVLTSRRAVVEPDFLMHLKSDHDMPIFMHPADAEHEDIADLDVPFFDPTDAKIFKDFGVEILPTPFVTEGSIAVYSETDRGFIMCGDAAVTPGPESDASPAPARLELPDEYRGDEAEFREFWKQFLDEDRPLFSIFPRRGPAYQKRREIESLIETITSH